MLIRQIVPALASAEHYNTLWGVQGLKIEPDFSQQLFKTNQTRELTVVKLGQGF